MKKQEVNPLNGELMTPDLEQLKKRRDELNEIIDRLEIKESLIFLSDFVNLNPNHEIIIHIDGYPNFDLKCKNIKIIVD